MPLFIESTHLMTDIYQIDSRGKLAGNAELGGQKWAAVGGAEPWAFGGVCKLSRNPIVWPKLDRVFRLRLVVGERLALV